MATKDNRRKSPQEAGDERDILSIPISEESLTRETRIGLPANYIGFSRLSRDEITLDFIKISIIENKATKDLVSRITLSAENAKALRDLLDNHLQ